MAYNMLIIRRDLENILKVMNKFEIDHVDLKVENDENDNGAGQYDLSIEFTHYVNNTHCRIKVEIDQYLYNEN
jgi:hypothetical protein